MIVNNLGILYKDTQRLAEAEEHYQEALTIRRDLAKTNPSAYLSDVADILNNLGLLYFAQDKKAQAHSYFKEIVTIRRQQWKQYPELHADKLAWALVLSALTLTEDKKEKSCALFTEAFKVARSEEFKQALLLEDIKQGARCKLHNLILNDQN